MTLLIATYTIVVLCYDSIIIIDNEKVRECRWSLCKLINLSVHRCVNPSASLATILISTLRDNTSTASTDTFSTKVENSYTSLRKLKNVTLFSPRPKIKLSVNISYGRPKRLLWSSISKCVHWISCFLAANTLITVLVNHSGKYTYLSWNMTPPPWLQSHTIVWLLNRMVMFASYVISSYR